MSDGNALLELQRLDTQADGLREERAALPERAAIAAIDASLAEAAAARAQHEAQRQSLAEEERRVERETAGVRAEAEQVEADLYGGKVTALAELEGLQTKLASLKGQCDTLESRQLELLEGQEAEEAAIAALAERVASLEEERRALEASLAAAEAVVDEKLGRVAEARATVTPNLSAARLGVYQQLRENPRLQGRAAAALEDGQCTACRVKLPILDARRVREAGADEAVTCPKCQRILVPG